mmetsp:Transcript_105104/g.250204  ORF Transcript_105104/g.250204 Transcript_105104/m.250204 type:complete len:309 (+) Transcript_105104:45-971(+)
MFSVAPPKVAPASVSAIAAQPSLLHSPIEVANKVLWPCGRAVCSVPARAVALLGVALGLRRSKRRPTTRKISGSTASHGKPWKEHRNPLEALVDQLRHVFEGVAGHATAVHKLQGQRSTTLVEVQEPETDLGVFVQPGSMYQNEYMTLWNDNNDPVSAVLRVLPNEHCELVLSNLDSVHGGSEGWIIFRSAYTMHDVPHQPKRKRLQLRGAKSLTPLEYNDKLFERPAQMALGLLKRASWMLSGAFALEFDLETNQVHAGPRAAVLKPFWQTTVALMPTEEKDLWTFEPVHTEPEHAAAYAERVLVPA